jgi:hypothetical protein
MDFAFCVESKYVIIDGKNVEGFVMQAVEFEADIENGIVHIPKEYRDLYEKKEVKFIAIYDNNSNKYKNNAEKQKKKMSAISIDTVGFKFDRNEAHER